MDAKKKYLLIRPPLEEAIPPLPAIKDKRLYSYIVAGNAIESNLPYGLLKIASMLHNQGHDVKVMDFGPKTQEASRVQMSPYDKRPVGLYGNKEYPISLIGDNFDSIRNILNDIDFDPDEIFITTSMTFHAKSICETTRLCREIFPESKIALGGIYASLCKDHAKEHTTADTIHVGPMWEAEDSYADVGFLSYKPNYYLFKGTRGCPFKCSYCAVHKIEGHESHIQSPDKIADEIINAYNKYGIHYFISWESNLLVNWKNYFEIMLNRIIESGINIEIDAPEGLSPHLMTAEIAVKMKKAGFKSVNIPLETSDDDMNLKRFKRQTKKDEFVNCINNLLDAGFKNRNIWIFCLVGMPEQSLSSQVNTLLFVWKMKLKPFFTFFTPIPQTEEYEKYYHLISEKNLSDLHPYLFPFAGKEFSISEMEDLLTLQSSMHPLERMKYLSYKSRVRKMIMDEIISDIEFRKDAMQDLLYSEFIDDFLYAKGIAIKKEYRLIHFYIYDFQKQMQNWDAPEKIKKRIFFHKQNIALSRKVDTSLNASGIADFFSGLYMTKSELKDHIASMKGNRGIIRLWNHDTSFINRIKEFAATFTEDIAKEFIQDQGLVVENINSSEHFIEIEFKG